MHHADPTGLIHSKRVSMMYECSTSELLAGGCIHASWRPRILKQHAALTGLIHCIANTHTTSPSHRDTPTDGIDRIKIKFDDTEHAAAWDQRPHYRSSLLVATINPITFIFVYQYTHVSQCACALKRRSFYFYIDHREAWGSQLNVFA